MLQAPKVTTFNGAPATIFNNTVQYYVQELLPIVGPGAVAYTPVIGLIPTGPDAHRHPGRLGRPPLRPVDADAVLQRPQQLADLHVRRCGRWWRFRRLGCR